MSRNRAFEDDPEDQPQVPDDGSDAYEPLDVTKITESDLLGPEGDEG
jgi:hypothetical protein